MATPGLTFVTIPSTRRKAEGHRVSHKATELLAVISSDRFSTYEAAADGDSDHALALYTWNIACSAAFYGPLQVLEVALRNALHNQLASLFQSSTWWDAPDLQLLFVQRGAITNALAKLRQARKAVTPGRVIAELPFGFWVGLLGRGQNYEMCLWRPALRHAFPSYRSGRKQLHARFDHVRALRNRIAHHEPIFDRHLRADFKTICDLAALISPASETWIRTHSRVTDTLTQRPNDGLGNLLF